MYCLGMAPPTTWSTKWKPSPRSRGSMRMRRHAELAVAAGLLLVLALGLGLLGDRLADRRRGRPRCRPRRRTCGASRSAATARWVSPVPRRMVWWVSSTRSTTRARSSSCRRCRPVMSLSSSPLDLGRMATDRTTGSGGAAGHDDRGALGGQGVAGGGVGRAWARPRCRRPGPRPPAGPPCPAGAAGRGASASAWVRGLVRTVSGLIVPDSTRRSEILPT